MAPKVAGSSQCPLCLKTVTDSAGVTRRGRSRFVTPCHSPSSKSHSSWDIRWTESCAESVCQLLDLELETFKAFFVSGGQCPGCKQLLRDVDFLVRRVDALNSQLSTLKVTLAELLHDNIQGWIEQNDITPTPNKITKSKLDKRKRFSVNSYNKVTGKRNRNLNIDMKPASPASACAADFEDMEFSPAEIKEEPLEIPDFPETVPMIVHLDPKTLPTKVSPTAAAADRQMKQNLLRGNQAPQNTEMDLNRRSSNRMRNVVSYLEDTDNQSEYFDNNAEIYSDFDENVLKRKCSNVSTASTDSLAKRIKQNIEDESVAYDSDFRPLEGNGEAALSTTFGNDLPELVKSRVQNSVPIPKSPRIVKSGSKAYCRLATDPTLSKAERETVDFLIGLEREEKEKNFSYVCPIHGCARRFIDYRRLRLHSAKVHNQSLHAYPFQCPFCNLPLLHDYQLDAHILRLHQGERECYICPVNDCPHKFRFSDSFLQHMTSHHPEHSMPVSRSIFKHRIEYRDKSLVGTAEVQTVRRKGAAAGVQMYCPFEGCTRRCTSQLMLDMHYNEVHVGDPLPFKCGHADCSKAFKGYDRYLDHMSLKHGMERPKGVIINCLYCTWRCFGQSSMNVHMRAKHTKDDVPKFNCRVCDLVFFLPELCTEHEKLHDEEKRADKDGCTTVSVPTDTGFANVTLNAEATGFGLFGDIGDTMDTTLHKFKCVMHNCKQKYFETQEELKAHVRREHDSSVGKKKVCDICGTRTKSNWTLKKHMNTHRAEMPFKCNHCDKRFKNDLNRVSHEEIVHSGLGEQRIYNCKLCDATFTARQYLYKHNSWHKHGSNANLPVKRKKPICA